MSEFIATVNMSLKQYTDIQNEILNLKKEIEKFKEENQALRNTLNTFLKPLYNANVDEKICQNIFNGKIKDVKVIFDKNPYSDPLNVEQKIGITFHVNSGDK